MCGDVQRQCEGLGSLGSSLLFFLQGHFASFVYIVLGGCCLPAKYYFSFTQYSVLVMEYHTSARVYCISRAVLVLVMVLRGQCMAHDRIMPFCVEYPIVPVMNRIENDFVVLGVQVYMTCEKGVHRSDV